MEAKTTIYSEAPKPKVVHWEIRFVMFNAADECVGVGMYHKRYKRKGNAIRIAKKIYGDPSRFSGLFTYSWAVVGVDSFGRIVEYEREGEK
jgi:hypothetical protein